MKAEFRILNLPIFMTMSKVVVSWRCANHLIAEFTPSMQITVDVRAVLVARVFAAMKRCSLAFLAIMSPNLEAAKTTYFIQNSSNQGTHRDSRNKRSFKNTKNPIVYDLFSSCFHFQYDHIICHNSYQFSYLTQLVPVQLQKLNFVVRMNLIV